MRCRSPDHTSMVPFVFKTKAEAVPHTYPLKLAGAERFELPRRVLETLVLPLHHAPTHKSNLISNQFWFFKQGPHLRFRERPCVPDLIININPTRPSYLFHRFLLKSWYDFRYTGQFANWITLIQLINYQPTKDRVCFLDQKYMKMVCVIGFEPMFPCSQGKCDSQTSPHAD